ncbi:ent-kaur-16-ene synthase [Fusarium albosuccineum]|uniref:Ent-kaur-16-ene synthase n=1 Tax=Fusarium albosuccineum TaxID=1237068 RepID=A0A8H4LCT0_9HYPO|nr:ent-kaur-16-ene synthase [Fusarium albosuccineum]
MSPSVLNGTASSADGSGTLATAAKSLLTRAYASYHSHYGICTTSCQVYDTAWVAMIPKTTDNVKHWLFPECFYYLLKTQSDDGSWGVLPTTQTAGILDTASALLALLSHARDPLQIVDVSPDEINQRIERGFVSLHNQLSQWDDVETTNHIGVELIVPALLNYLQQERGSLSFDFPCKVALESMHKDKMSHFNLEVLYSKKPSSALHSLESFLGQLDFDRVSHHLYHGSMLASPSSTAAYLIGASKWDDEAESYLRHIVKAGAGHGDGGIPGTYPTTHFECSWTLATLLKGGFPRKEIECAGLHGLADILDDAFQNENGIIGFAPRTADVDDTAKGLLALNLAGRPVSPDTMIQVFEGQTHFTTFGSERDPSLTSNLHVLLCLLHQPDISRYLSQILKTTFFACRWWWDSDFRIKDKWHLSHLYPTMLLVEAFTDLLRLIDSGELSGIIDENWRCRVGVSLFQACLRIMLDQNDDGSWGDHREQTCYAILALSQARRVCFFNEIRVELQSCIDRGSSWLKSCSLHSQDLTWTSKTAYEVGFVAEAYKLAALKAALPDNSPGTIGHSLNSAHVSSDLERYMRLVRKTALFALLDEWQVRASMIESSFFVPLLQAQRLEIYPRDDAILAEDKYLSIIPFTWVGCNNRSRAFAPTTWLYDMMLLSLLGYQTDEFLEAVAAPVFKEGGKLHEVIDNIIDSAINGLSQTENGCKDEGIDVDAEEKTNGHDTNGHFNALLTVENITPSLTRFTSHVLNHEAVLKSSRWDRENLHQEFRAFMHAHATQLEDNARFAKQQNSDTFVSPTQSYFHWVRTIGGNHVACAYSFAFSNCLISTSLGQGEEVFPTVTQKYLAAAVTRHLTTMCRMYNDFGSLARDSAERNVNSMHFPEFSLCNKTSVKGIDTKKQSLVQLAEYEHACVNQALDALGRAFHEKQGETCMSSLEARKLMIVRLFCDVTDLYDQLYVIKDLSSHLK